MIERVVEEISFGASEIVAAATAAESASRSSSAGAVAVNVGDTASACGPVSGSGGPDPLGAAAVPSTAPSSREVVVDAAFVRRRVADLLSRTDLSKYIL